MLSNAEMEAAAGQVRILAANLNRVIRELDLPHSWSGDDADQFQRQWEDLVNARLMAAAAKLDGISFEEVVDAING